jgi:hypothetical protein
MIPDTIVPIAGMLSGIVVVGFLASAVVKIFHGPVGQALARRLSGGAGAGPEVLGEVEELRQQLEHVQQRLLDAEERLDFSERLLAQRSEAERR